MALKNIEGELCQLLINTINVDGNYEDVLDVFNIAKASFISVKNILEEVSDLDAYRLIKAGLHPGHIIDAISKRKIFDQELLITVIEYAKTDEKLLNKFFSPCVLARVLSNTDDNKRETYDHVLKILTILEKYGISLDIKASGFSYYGKDMKDIVMLLSKHGVGMDHLLYWCCDGCCDAEAIKYLVKDLGVKCAYFDGTILDLISQKKGCNVNLLRFLIEDMKISTHTKRNGRTPFDNILTTFPHVECVAYMCSVDAPTTIDLNQISSGTIRGYLIFFGKVKLNKKEYSAVYSISKMWTTYLKDTITKICEGKLTGTEVFRTDMEPVWDPDQINFSKVPLNYFLDAVLLFCHGSYHENHPYYQKVIDRYGQRHGFDTFSETFKRNIEKTKTNLKIISTLLHWSPIERQMLGDEAERDAKRIKNKQII